MLYRFTALLLLPLLFTTAFSQELTYSQNGLSYTKGTIDSEVLVDLIQEKQRELNKFVLSRIVTKTWIVSKDKHDHFSDRIDNFTTKYLVYSSLNDLTLTGDKTRFGTNTLELLKESAILFGLAVAVNDQFYGDTANIAKELKIGRFKGDQTSVDYENDTDTIAFNQTIDMVLNICITNPQLSGYFPIYGQLTNDEDDNRVWYETDSRYYQMRSDSAVAAEYIRVKQRIDQLYAALQTIKQDWDEVKNGDLSPLLDAHAGKLTAYILPETSRLRTVEADIRRIVAAVEKYPVLRDGFAALLKKGDSLRFDHAFIGQVRQLRYNYDALKATAYRSNMNYDRGKTEAFLKAFAELIPAGDKALEERLQDFRKELDKRLDNNSTVPKSTIQSWLAETAAQNPAWKTVTQSKRLSGYTSDAASLLENILGDLEQLASRTEMIRSLCTAIASAKKPGPLNQFVLDRQQLISTKALIERFIDHVDKSGKYNVPAVYLRSIIDNITYNDADSALNKPASVGLSFESVVLSLNNVLVTPARLERTRYFQPYISIGLNYASFLNDNSLHSNDDGTFSRLSSMTYASERIGVKYKIINRQYTRSFKPGVVYRYYGKNWYWERPQQQGLFDDVFIDLHTGGLLYNVADLTTEEDYSFPFVGSGVGVRFFNGLTAAVSLDVPYTGDAFARENLFLLFSIDVPIVEYLSKLGKKN